MIASWETAFCHLLLPLDILCCPPRLQNHPILFPIHWCSLVFSDVVQGPKRCCCHRSLLNARTLLISWGLLVFDKSSTGSRYPLLLPRSGLDGRVLK